MEDSDHSVYQQSEICRICQEVVRSLLGTLNKSFTKTHLAMWYHPISHYSKTQGQSCWETFKSEYTEEIKTQMQANGYTGFSDAFFEGLINYSTAHNRKLSC